MSDTIRWLIRKYDSTLTSHLNVTRVPINKFLGMKFYYSIKSSVIISMFDHVRQIVNEFPDTRKLNQL